MTYTCQYCKKNFIKESIWNKFMSMQHPINVYNFAIADNDLTIVEQAYRNFLNKDSKKL